MSTEQKYPLHQLAARMPVEIVWKGIPRGPRSPYDMPLRKVSAKHVGGELRLHYRTTFFGQVLNFGANVSSTTDAPMSVDYVLELFRQTCHRDAVDQVAKVYAKSTN